MSQVEELIAPERPWRISRADYDQMVALGILEGQHVELLHGVIVEMRPIGPDHASPVDLLMELLVPALRGRARVRIQHPYLAAGDSEPEPDVAVVPVGDYTRSHPDRAHLIVEVAGSSLRKDRTLKAALYAVSNVEEYWIVNVAQKSVEVHRGPSADGWRSVTRHARDETLALLAFPDLRILIADFMGE